jgi:hypothetical protein
VPYNDEKTAPTDPIMPLVSLVLFSLLALFAAPFAAAAEPPSGYIVGLHDSLSPAEVKSVAEALECEYGVTVVRTYTAALTGLHVQATEEMATKLAADARVAYVDENEPIALTADSKITEPVNADRTRYAPGWSLQRITHRDRIAPDAEGAYPFASAGDGILAYVFDSGVWAGHPDLHDRVEAGYDTFIPGSSALAHDPCPVDSAISVATRDACPPGDACLAGGHGTMAASLIGGSTFGIASGVTIVPVRVTDCAGTGQMTNLIDGLDWILREHMPAADESGFHGAVINMSLHIRSDADLPEVRSLKSALARVVARGAVVFTGAGNTPVDACGGYPSGFSYGNGQSAPHVISISGVNHSDARDCASALAPPVDVCIGPQYGIGRCVDLFAPAVDMRGAGLREGGNGIGPMRLTAREGTSWASPQGAGAAARLLAERAGTSDPLYRSDAPEQTSDNVWRALRDNATFGIVKTPGPESANRLLYIGAIEITTQPRSIVTRGDEGTTPLTIAIANPPEGTTYSWRRGTFADFTIVQESANPTYDAPAGESASYWVRASYPHTPRPVTVDSVLVKVTHCSLADALPIITATPAADGHWRLHVPPDSDATQYQWFIGAPGDVSQPVATTSTPELDVVPLSTTDYWVRVAYPGCSTIDSGNYATATTCLAPRILQVPEGPIPLGTQPGQAHRPYTLEVVADGTNLVYQWYRVIGGNAEEIAGADRTSVTLDPAAGEQTVFVRVTSLCGAKPFVDSSPATVSWVNCDLAFGLARHPNRDPEKNDSQMPIASIGPATVYVPMGRSIALTARPVTASQNTTDATLTWLEGQQTVASGSTYYVRNVVNATSIRQLELRMAQRGSPDCAKLGYVRIAACRADVRPLITRFPLSDGTGVARLEVRDAKDVIVEWRTGEHDDSAPAFIDRLQPGDRVSTREFAPGTRYWARVTASDICKSDLDELTEDTEVYTAQACSTNAVDVRDPATGNAVNVGNGHTIHVPPGGAVALHTTASDIRWSDSAGTYSASSYYAESIISERLVTLESPAGCFSGSVTLHVATGCKPLIKTPPASTSGPWEGKATLSVSIDPAYADPIIEWWEGEHDTSGEPVARNVSSFVGDTGKTYWVRVIGKCGEQLLVQDSSLATVHCNNCRRRSVRHGPPQ